MSAEDLQLMFLDPKTTTDPQINELIRLMSESFKAFNVSVGASAEVVEEDFGNPHIAAIAITSICKGADGFMVTNNDGKIVGASFFVDVHAKGSRVASLGPVVSTVPGAGKRTFEAACAHAENLGFTTLVLMQAAADTRSFSLYAKLDFQAKHACHYFGGFIPQSEPSSPPAADTDTFSLAAMTAADVKDCADLFLAARGTDSGWDREPDIVGMLQAGTPFPKFHCPMELPGLASWALAQRLTLLRVNVIMVRGHYEQAWPDSGYIVTPSVAGW